MWGKHRMVWTTKGLEKSHRFHHHGKEGEKKLDNWNPAGYLKFEYERTLPSRDLAAHVRVEQVRNIIDIGCGPGNSTKVLRDTWPHARILGLDSSEQMIAKARATYPEGEWIVGDAQRWSSRDRFDVVFSNAALQWMSDRAQVLTNLFRHLNVGGAVAVQVPLIGDSPLHRALAAVSQYDEWEKLLRGAGLNRTDYDDSFYYGHLSTLTTRIEMWITTYLHIMESHQAIIDWYSSTGMRPYLERISSDERRRTFVNQVLELCSPEYPIQPNGKVIFPFKRLFFVAWNDT